MGPALFPVGVRIPVGKGFCRVADIDTPLLLVGIRVVVWL
jgi:hypothetical protein